LASELRGAMKKENLHGLEHSRSTHSLKIPKSFFAGRGIAAMNGQRALP